MPYVVALTQFVFIALGTLAVNILIKAEGYPSGDLSSYSPSAVFLSQNGIWLLVIPIVWLACALGAEKWKGSLFSPRVVQPIGVLLAIAIFAVYAGVVFFQF